MLSKLFYAAARVIAPQRNDAKKFPNKSSGRSFRTLQIGFSSSPLGIHCRPAMLRLRKFMTMRVITAEQVHAALRFPDFIDALQKSFAGSYTMPPRQVMLLDETSSRHDAFAMLPSWNDEVIALKAFTYFPENQAPHRTLYSQILVFDRKRGEPLALVDGVSVTCWRTAGVSALASRFLSRPDTETLLLLGTGKLAPFLIHAHASVRYAARRARSRQATRAGHSARRHGQRKNPALCSASRIPGDRTSHHSLLWSLRQ